MLTETIITVVSLCVIKGVVSDLVKEAFQILFGLDNILYNVAHPFFQIRATL